MERRTDAQMFGMLLSFAREDSRVRAIWMNGSRANPNAPADRWQDFDIVYAVTEMDSFLSDDSWVDRFGERAMMQTRRDQYDSYGPGETADYSDWFIYLMQFADGNRVDLSLVPAENAAETVLSDKMCVVLLDKDGLLPPVPPATDEDYRAGLPTPLEFRCSVNEFWWVSGNVDKGLRRGEVSYAQEMLGIVREELLRMLTWKAALCGPLNPGKCGKFLPRFLPAEDWAAFCETYARGDCADIRRAMEAGWSLFSRVCREVGGKAGFPVDESAEAAALAYLRRA